MNYPLVLRGGRAATGEGTDPAPVDLAIGAGGRIEAIGPRLAVEGAAEWQLGGRLVLPGLVDAHQHLDKSGTARQVISPSGTLLGAVESWAAYARQATREDILDRARRTAEACLARGTVAIRSHANLDLEWELRGLEALLELRAGLAGRLRLQVAGFVTGSLARAGLAQVRQRIEAALELGLEVIGGAPALAPDPAAFTDLLFEVAARRGLLLDLHIDETLDPQQPMDITHVARRTRELGLAGRVAVGHACLLSALPPDEARPIIEALAEAGVGVITLPAANLFLQGRRADRLPPRGLTRVADLLAAGARVACASDNIRDPFVPVGSGDLLEIGRWTFLAGQLAAGQLPEVWAMVTRNPAALMGFGADYGLRPGAFADLLIVAAEDPVAALAGGPPERTVFFRGRHVSGPSLAGAEAGR